MMDKENISGLKELSCEVSALKEIEYLLLNTYEEADQSNVKQDFKSYKAP